MTEEARFSSRKLIVMVTCFTVGITLSYFGKLDQVTSDFIVYMSAAYLAGNVFDKAAQGYKIKHMSGPKDVG